MTASSPPEGGGGGADKPVIPGYSPSTLHPENASNVFRPHYVENIWKATISGHFGLVFEENSISAHHVIIVTRCVYEKLHAKTKSQRLHIPPVWKRVFETLRFRDGLVWTVGLTVELDPWTPVFKFYRVDGPKFFFYRLYCTALCPVYFQRLSEADTPL